MAISGDTGWVTLQDFTNDAAVGTRAWADPTYAELSDNSRSSATNDVYDTWQYTQRLRSQNPAISGYLHPTASIVGVQVSVERLILTGSANDAYDVEASLVVGDSVTGNNKASATGWTTTESAITYGGAADVWGVSGMTLGDIGAGFGFSLRARMYSVDDGSIAPPYTLIGVDQVKIRIHWENRGRMLLAF